jgi:hypothetical protein
MGLSTLSSDRAAYELLKVLASKVLYKFLLKKIDPKTLKLLWILPLCSAKKF